MKSKMSQNSQRTRLSLPKAIKSASIAFFPVNHFTKLVLLLNPLKTSSEYTQAGVYGRCVLLQNQIVFDGLKEIYMNSIEIEVDNEGV